MTGAAAGMPLLTWRRTVHTDMVVKYQTPDDRFRIVGYANLRLWELSGVVRRTQWEVREFNPDNGRYRLLGRAGRKQKAQGVAEGIIRRERAAQQRVQGP